MKPADRYWILEFTFDALSACVRMVLTANPDFGTKDREIIVTQVVNFHAERYHDAKKAVLGDFSGATVTQHGPHWRYSVDTGDATIQFDSLEKIDV
jgi:hypothetical protein